MKDKTRKAIPLRGRKTLFDQLNALLPKLHPAQTAVGKNSRLGKPIGRSSCSIKELAKRPAPVTDGDAAVPQAEHGRLRGIQAAFVQDLVWPARTVPGRRQCDRAGDPDNDCGAHAGSRAEGHRRSRAIHRFQAVEQSRCRDRRGEARISLGVGGSSAILADEADNGFSGSGIAVQSSADPYRQYMAAAIAGEGDFFLCMSATGKPAPVVESAKSAGARMAPLSVRSRQATRSCCGVHYLSGST